MPMPGTVSRGAKLGCIDCVDFVGAACLASSTRELGRGARGRGIVSHAAIADTLPSPMRHRPDHGTTTIPSTRAALELPLWVAAERIESNYAQSTRYMMPPSRWVPSASVNRYPAHLWTKTQKELPNMAFRSIWRSDQSGIWTPVRQNRANGQRRAQELSARLEADFTCESTKSAKQEATVNLDEKFGRVRRVRRVRGGAQ